MLSFRWELIRDCLIRTVCQANRMRLRSVDDTTNMSGTVNMTARPSLNCMSSKMTTMPISCAMSMTELMTPFVNRSCSELTSFVTRTSTEPAGRLSKKRNDSP